MGSSRLPDKVLLDIGGHPMIAWVVERTRRATCLNNVIIATTNDSADDSITAFCVEQSYPYTRGSVHDVLDRYYQTARAFNANIIVRITADCPLIDPTLVDLTVQAFFQPVNSYQLSVISNQTNTCSLTTAHWHFAANRLPPPWNRTYPIGLDVEVCTFAALETAWREATEPYHREHVMPYLYENEGQFNILPINHDVDYGHMRWTVDTPEDLELVREIVSRFPDDTFTWIDVVDLIKREPELAEINANVRHKTVREVDDHIS